MKKHPRDQRISFEKESHTYFVDGKPISTSVTSFIHSFFNQFNPDKIIEKYYEIWQTNPNSKYYGLEKEEIKQIWEINGKEASKIGTELHENIETFYKLNKEIEIKKNEYKYFINFHKENKNLKPIRSEWMIFDKELDLAGSIDMIYQNENKELIMIDWKRTKEIKENSNDFGKYPLSHLPNTNYWHYSLQLNLYKNILERKYNTKINEMKLVILHPNNENYKIIPVKNMFEEIELILKERKNQIEIRNKTK